MCLFKKERHEIVFCCMHYLHFLLLLIAVNISTGLIFYKAEDSNRLGSHACGGIGCNCSEKTIECTDVAPYQLDLRVVTMVPHVTTVKLTNCHQSTLNLDIFQNMTHLRTIIINNCGLTKFIGSGHPHVHTVDISNNRITEWREICNLSSVLPSVYSIDVSGNWLTTITAIPCAVDKVHYLNLSSNKVVNIERVPHVNILDLSFNELSIVNDQWPTSLFVLNISYNRYLKNISSFTSLALTHLNVDGCMLKSISLIDMQRLQSLSIQENDLNFIDFDVLSLPVLEKLDLTGNVHLHSILGTLPHNLQEFHMTKTGLSYLPNGFFLRANRLHTVDITPNNWICDICLVRWLDSLPSQLKPDLNCSISERSDCFIGIGKRTRKETYEVRTTLTKSAVLPCDAYGQPAPSVEWWLVEPRKFIGMFNARTKTASTIWSRDDAYEVLIGGSLMINNARMELVERYQCVALNSKGNATMLVRFRLDFSNWYHLAMTKSVFWGSILAAILTCGVLFVVNIIWIVCRHIGLWWIKRIERNSRVREMVSALERYRQRQMATLHEGYHRKLEQIRENYHQQVEQLRTSYAYQAERFRDYKAAQMESMNQHLESIRDNYTMQVCRLREYGSRRVEQLCEGYERQVNRVRTFSLQQRLNLMRKYKVKQQYLNKLLERFGDESLQEFVKPQPEVLLDESIRAFDVRAHRRLGSFHSLPEYLLQDEDIFTSKAQDYMADAFDKKVDTVISAGDEVPCCSTQSPGQQLCKQESVSLEMTFPVIRRSAALNEGTLTTSQHVTEERTSIT